MIAPPLTRQLLDAVKALPQERQEQLLELIRTWAPLPTTEASTDPANRLRINGRLDQEYLDLARSEVQSPPDLATVRTALAQIPGSLTADCIAERDER